MSDQFITYNCPHCQELIITYISEIGCGIFRHGYNIKTSQQLDPHTSKDICQQLENDPNIIGCCKAYKIINNNSNYVIEICDYI